MSGPSREISWEEGSRGDLIACLRGRPGYVSVGTNFLIAVCGKIIYRVRVLALEAEDPSTATGWKPTAYYSVNRCLNRGGYRIEEDEDGSLIVECRNGEAYKIHVGQVEYRLDEFLHRYMPHATAKS